MADPKPIEYELEDTNAKKPETEAEAVARIQREDEERARHLGLIREKGAPVGKKWADGIGGNSANAVASRLLEQEARVAQRKREAQTAALKTMIVGAVLLLIFVVGAALALDYTGTVKLGIFNKTAAAAELVPIAEPPPPAPVAAAPQIAAPTPPPKIQVLGVIGEATPLDNPPSEPPPQDSRAVTTNTTEPAAPTVDAAAVKKWEKKRDGAQRGIDTVNADLAKVQGRIEGNLRSLYGILPRPRDVVPARSEWRSPCAVTSEKPGRVLPEILAACRE